MIIMLLALLLATLAFPCVLMPEQVWKAFNVGDDVLDCGMHDVNLVALRNPVRDSGPPVCMAKLIMLRHKINQNDQKKRRSSSHARHSRSPSRSKTNAPHVSQRPRSFAWMKFGKKMQ